MSEPVVYRYGTDPSQFGELWLPEGAALGTVVLLHGGSGGPGTTCRESARWPPISRRAVTQPGILSTGARPPAEGGRVRSRTSRPALTYSPSCRFPQTR